MRHILGITLLLTAWSVVYDQLAGYKPEFGQTDEVGELIRQSDADAKSEAVVQRSLRHIAAAMGETEE